MLNLQQAIEIKESILEYLKATFTFQDKEVHKAFYEFIEHPENGMFKGPYVSLKLPFVKANSEQVDSIPLVIKPNWQPYDHQVKAWHRLSTKNSKPKPTIITTGTGSGKTEAFLYPVLDYCYKNHKKQGIKVIILYPMNALATDQAKRLAEAIYEDERTKGKITAGLFIGEGKSKISHPRTMAPNHIIEDRESILSSPPDILLTNFKMLDYALMKNNFHDLWNGNFKDSKLLQFLILDELHTYDGAQGSDVANLIRRLKLKINIPNNHLCPVGTSATIGSGNQAPQLLSDYASKIFGEPIDTEAIITENRLKPNDFFSKKLDDFFPREIKLKETKPITNEGYKSYIERQFNVWQTDYSTLSEDLQQYQIVKDLVSCLNTGKEIYTIEELIKNISKINFNLKKLPEWNSDYNFNPQEAVIQSLFALISEAKTIDEKNGRKSPFLYSQAQLWIRELRGLLRLVTDKPQFTWKDGISADEETLAMPAWFCRECGASGWLGAKHDNKERFEKDIKDVYSKFFSNHKHIYFFNKTDKFSMADTAEVGYEPSDAFKIFVNNKNLEFYPEKGKNNIDITALKKLTSKGYADHVCPECNTRNTMSIIGTRTATLSSIAVSQTLATDLDEQNEKERKVLAFTNSVQDAAHQAGFIESRNYRFTFRSSLQKVINSINEPVNLDELSEKFINYWKNNADANGKHHLEAYYYRFYPTDYLGKSSPKDYKIKTGYAANFKDEFDNRVKWEILSEFGYNAIIGRTLEKTCSSGVFTDKKIIDNIWLKFSPWLNENNVSSTIEEQNFKRFLHLIIHRIRIRGAVDNVYLEKFRSNNLKLWDLNWMRDNRHFLNKNFGKNSRFPRLLTYKKETKGVLDTTFTQIKNWFHTYYTKTFVNSTNNVDFLNEFYTELLKIMVQEGLLNEKIAQDMPNLAINPKVIFVHNTVKTFECDKCGDKIYTADLSDIYANGLCLKHRCTGRYKLSKDDNSQNYYRMVYNRKRSPRIYAADHTGLLERSKREKLEIDFKTRPYFNSINAMVATSTLEMGIDIGNLNTAFNNSIPPLPSNFLQRVGRAGRSSGSALLINFSQTKAHDLFYYADPKEMMSGEINTPGCFLEAKEILKRHFFAFCIDSWTSENPKENIIPSNIKYLVLEKKDVFGADFFMTKILNFVEHNEEKLFNRFSSLYLKDVRQEVLDNLKESVKNQHFYISNSEIFNRVKKEIKSLRNLIQNIIDEIKERKLGETDYERIELENELKSLKGIIRAIKKRNTLEHLTNIGALPNYAFPETGVTLTAKVIGNKPEGSTQAPTNNDFEIVRSSVQAIREFAPDNFFYSQSYRFKITGINTFDWSEKAIYHTKRFCSKCDHIEIEIPGAEVSKYCPKCNDESWGSASNVHSFAKLTTVKSFNNRADATLSDNKDEREMIFYTISRHLKFDNTKSGGVWAMTEIPLGIEFVKNITVTEINTGRTDVIDAKKIEINEIEAPTHGFITCKYCGKSSSNIKQKDYKQHYAYCKYKNKEYSGKPDNVFDEVFFFREIETEALKILLPIQEFNSDAEIKMFKAGIELGLKKYYKGNPAHINIVDYKEYNQITTKFDKYLVLYDTIPGGTGYLEKLFDWKQFNVLLKIAYTQIANCECQYEGKDGCYKCIYSYTNQYYQKDLSRKRAEKRFYEIISKSESWENFTTSLNSITNTGHIEESELEERFIKSLKLLEKHDKKWKIEEINEDGIINYLLKYSENKTQLTFHIRPQVHLSSNVGVKYETVADFMILCTEAEINGEKINDLQTIPKIAVYLDGYLFHASNKHNRFENDVKKRRAIISTQEYKTWSLTWNDLDLFDKQFEDNSDKNKNNNNDFLFSLLEEDYKTTKNNLLKSSKIKLLPFFEANNNFSRLLEVLKHPIIDTVFNKSIALFLGMFHAKLGNPSYAPDNIAGAFINNTNENYCKNNRTINALIPVSLLKKNNLFNLKTIVNIESAYVASKFEILNIENIEKEEWNNFWIVFNLLQFSEISFGKEEKEENSILEDLLGMYEEKYHSIIKDLIQSGYIKTNADKDMLNSLTDSDGNLIAEAELIIRHKKIAIFPFSEQDKKILIEKGYEIKEI